MPETFVAAEELGRFARRAFAAAGLTERHATAGAETLMWASLRGVDTHGIRNLRRYYLSGIEEGLLQADAVFPSLHETPIAVRIDGQSGVGLCAATAAMERAIEKANALGAGFATVCNSHHFGAAGRFADMACDRGMLGICLTGCFFAHGQDKAVVPYGGASPMLSTNPIAFACPSACGRPLVLDMATSISPLNRLELFDELSRSVPLGWALDEDGRPTSDPGAVHAMTPLGGVGDQGGHKGYGLALMVQVLTGVLSGAWGVWGKADNVYGDDKTPFQGHVHNGVAHFMAAIRIDSFLPVDTFQTAVSAMAAALQESPPAAGFERVMVSGQREWETLQRRAVEGVPLPGHVWQDLCETAEHWGVAAPTPISR
ncbi:MAG: Ldh family oxidoreductase [Pirellulaceae bacterium]|jgi:LDH2 family malate/lactate/ureidoglycolate dehydrogenase|nr:Ldh family oxidoreductase [Pirellulaceae bacterium]MDP7015046.1 Ldh family oxidoreductase [Pirellulaceae bacterium]